MPTRNAPTAADTWSFCVMPATTSASPSTTRSSISGLSDETALLSSRPWRNARYSTVPTVPRAIASVTPPAASPRPASRVVSSGR